MSIIPCEQNAELHTMIEQYADALQLDAHLIGEHGLTEREFYDSGILRGAVEILRGRYAASRRDKQDFVRRVLNELEDGGRIHHWETIGEQDRHDYRVQLADGTSVIIITKGCLDGNNTSIYQRPTDVDELIVWSLCTNPGADMRRNLRSGIRTRLSPKRQREHGGVDGLIVWDSLCNSSSRPCPKVLAMGETIVTIGPYMVPPPCLYSFPPLSPKPILGEWTSQRGVGVGGVGCLRAFSQHFGSKLTSLNLVQFEETRGRTDIRVIPSEAIDSLGCGTAETLADQA